MLVKSNFIGSTLNILTAAGVGIKSRFSGGNPNTKEYWDTKLRRYKLRWRSSTYEQIAAMLPDDEPFSLLDVGCALGDGCELLKQTFPQAQITGLDFSEIGIAKARSKNRTIDYVAADIIHDPIPGRFDYITIAQTLEHFDDPISIVKKCLNHVKRSIIISTPYKQNTTYCLGEHRYSFDDNTFNQFNCTVVRTTDFKAEIGGKCIFYEIRP